VQRYKKEFIKFVKFIKFVMFVKFMKFGEIVNFAVAFVGCILNFVL